MQQAHTMVCSTEKQFLLLVACHAFSNCVSHVRIKEHTSCHDMTRYVTQHCASPSCVSGKFPVRKEDFFASGYIREPGLESSAKWQVVVMPWEKDTELKSMNLTSRTGLGRSPQALRVRTETVPKTLTPTLTHPPPICISKHSLFCPA